MVYSSTMHIKTYYKTLSVKQKTNFAARAGTSRAYIEKHLLRPFKNRKVPRKELMLELIKASNRKLKLIDMLLYFYIDKQKKS